MNVRKLLQAYGVQPRKSLGQNFLVDGNHLARVLAAAEIEPEDQVLEVGPGLGTLTRALAERADRVVAVEVDRRLVDILHDALADLPNVELFLADILQVNIGEIMGRERPYKVVANLPYQITSAALRHLLESETRPALVVVMVQWEVARRIVASPGEMSLLAVSVQFYGEPHIVARVPAGAFYPRPKVDSAILRIVPHAQPRLADRKEIERFFALVRAGFAQRRKQLRNALAAGLALPVQCIEQALLSSGIDPTRRAQTLSLAEWESLLWVLAGGQGWATGDR